ncbi:MAG: NUDIX domain-containing protein, partial [Candidatus Peribacteraceae bacterium]|nr:NUDIX domain-containing protein [Candidatus Peribacteraceae bacterium]
TEAALRELKEEAGLDGCRVLGVSERVYQYDFPESFRRFRPDNVKGQRIEYVFALAPKDAIVTVDGVEVDSSVWVEMEQVGQYVKRSEYLEIVKGLYDEATKFIG